MVDVNYIKLKVNVEGFTSCLLVCWHRLDPTTRIVQRHRSSSGVVHSLHKPSSRRFKMVFSGQSISTVTVLKVEKSPLFVM